MKIRGGDCRRRLATNNHRGGGQGTYLLGMRQGLFHIGHLRGETLSTLLGLAPLLPDNTRRHTL